MPILGMSTFCVFPGQTPAEALWLAADAGFTGLEVWLGPQAALPELGGYQASDLARLDREARRAGLALSLHAPSGEMNLASSDAGARQGAIRRLTGCIRLASRMGATTVVFHPGTVPAHTLYAEYPPLAGRVPRELAWQDARSRCADSIATTASVARREGVRLCAETMGHERGTVTPTAEDLVWLVDQVEDLPTVAVAMDTGHCALSWGVEPAVRILGSRIAYVHVNDTARGNNSGLRGHHAELGTGDIDFGALAPLLTRGGITLSLEVISFTDPEDVVRRSLGRLRELVKEAGRAPNLKTPAGR
ncbi:MAG: sugar phosphate isomerase/epimerase [Chloroflexi bacterium]|nr:sugar phosphate isomerase/epimerase [Chloroflexota bacterium]